MEVLRSSMRLTKTTRVRKITISSSTLKLRNMWRCSMSKKTSLFTTRSTRRRSKLKLKLKKTMMKMINLTQRKKKTSRKLKKSWRTTVGMKRILED